METRRKCLEFEQCLICLSTISRARPLRSQELIRTRKRKATVTNDESNVSNTFPPKQQDLLSSQLYVVFVLKNVLEVPSQQLRSYVEKWGNPENWIRVCDTCNAEIVKVKGMFEEMHKISREVEDEKEKLKEKFKSGSSDSSVVAMDPHNTDLNSSVTKVTAEDREMFLKKVSHKEHAPRKMSASVPSPFRSPTPTSTANAIENEDKMMDAEKLNVELLARLQSEDIYCDFPVMSGQNSPLEAESDSDLADVIAENENPKGGKQLLNHETNISRMDEESDDDWKPEPEESGSCHSDAEPKVKRRRGGATNSMIVEESVESDTDTDLVGNETTVVGKQLSEHETDTSRMDEESDDDDWEPEPEESDSCHSDAEPKVKRRRGGATNSMNVEESFESGTDMVGNETTEVGKQLSDHETDISMMEEESDDDDWEPEPVAEESDSSTSDAEPEPKVKRRKGGAKSSMKVEPVKRKSQRLKIKSTEHISSDVDVGVDNKDGEGEPKKKRRWRRRTKKSLKVAKSIKTKSGRIEGESREDISGADVESEIEEDQNTKAQGFPCSICPPGLAPKNPKNFIKTSIRHFLLHKEGHQKCTKCEYMAPIRAHYVTLSDHWSRYHRDVMGQTPVASRFIEVESVKPVIPWFCPEPTCKASFPSEEERDEHLESNHHVWKERSKYKCDLCPKTYVLLRDMVVHKLLVHDKLLNDLKKDLNKCASFSREEYMLKMRNQNRSKKPGSKKYATSKTHVTGKDPIDVNDPNRFQCTACRGELSRSEKRTLDEFLDHYLDHMTKTHKCSLCQRLYPLPDVQHGRSLHARKLMALSEDKRFSKCTPRLPLVPWWCPVCDALFRCDVERDDHLKSQHGNSGIEKSEKCQFCSRTYLNTDELKLHENTKHVMELRRKRCEFCDEVFLRESLLQDHKVLNHKVFAKLSQRKFLCDFPECKYKTPWTISEFLDHYVEHKKNKFKCSVVNCQARASNERYISGKHWGAHHQDLMPQTSVTSRYEVDENPPAPKVSWWCSLCDTEFASDDEKDAHLKEAHKHELTQLKENTDFCMWCPKSFNCPDELSVHTTTSHTLETRFIKCDECDEEFTTEKSLASHKQSTHKKSLFVCSFCGEELNCSDDYAATGVFMHVWKEHTRKTEKILPRIVRFQCDICKSVLRSQFNLYTHRKQVHKKKTFQMCQICGKGFSIWNSLKVHMANDHNCTECDEVLADQKLLREHKIEKHGIRHSLVMTGSKLNVDVRSEKSGEINVCHVCGSVLLTKAALNTHLRFKHKDAGYPSNK